MAVKKKINIFLILRLLGVGLFIFILTRVDLSDTAQALKNVDPALFGLGIVFQILLLLIKAIRWHIMNNGAGIGSSWVSSFGRFFESYAIGVITPGRVGELIKVGHEKNKNDKINTLIRIISERGFDVGFFVLIASLALMTGDFIQMSTELIWLIFIGGIVIVTVAFLLLSSKYLLKLLQNILSIFPGRMFEVELQSKQYMMTQTIFIFVLSFFSNMSHFVSCYYLSQSVSMDSGFLMISGGVAISGLLNMLPITVLGLGTRELTFLTVFKTYTQSTIIAFSATMLIVAQIGGGIIALILGQIFLFIEKKRN
ncbi:MAG: flippase-like domain-containing protein [Bacteroidales bacterium]|nr:flippase-like domain-containing protein [Bacteroidales bacterium]